MVARKGVNFRAFPRVLTALAAGGFAVASAHASDIPLKLTDRGFPIVEIAINGAGPFPMVLDTAAGITTVTTPVKDELGLRNIGRMPQPVQLAGGPQAVDLYLMGQVTLGGQSAPAPITIVLDAPMKYVREARGILGMNVLSRFSLDIYLCSYITDTFFYPRLSAVYAAESRPGLGAVLQKPLAAPFSIPQADIFPYILVIVPLSLLVCLAAGRAREGVGRLCRYAPHLPRPQK